MGKINDKWQEYKENREQTTSEFYSDYLDNFIDDVDDVVIELEDRDRVLENRIEALESELESLNEWVRQIAHR